jgi:hypothetical protein
MHEPAVWQFAAGGVRLRIVGSFERLERLSRNGFALSRRC